ncbi:MAG TPA: alpha-glucan family phosphorylase [Candidatus Krumholzibacteria bacterium]|nr:alpha-glucan family phosphorylase [Candidatus Krumholzibacteria bacterium]
MEIRDRLNELARNLYWTWEPDVEHIFNDLDPDLWMALNRNPIALLATLPNDSIESKIRTSTLGATVTRAYYTLRDYLEQRHTWGSHYVRSLRVNPVAYFSAEFGLHGSLPIYSGGLGVLAGDHLKAASDLDVPIVGVGLLYEQGYFRQSLDADGWQQEHYSAVDLAQVPLEAARDSNGEPVRVIVEGAAGERIHIRVWLARVGRARLLLLDTNVDGNSDDVRKLTANLYGGDTRMRIRQELVLGVGGLRALHAMGIHPGVLHLNEGHSTFAVLELARVLRERDGQTFENVRETVARMTVFTTHTPVPAGHDRFDPALVEENLGVLREQLGLSSEAFLALGRVNPEDHDETFCMTVLGLKMSRSRNAVSYIHGRITRAMWRQVWSHCELENIPIGHITNGVHIGTWLAPEMDRLYKRWLGEDWEQNMHDPGIWEQIDDIDAEELWEVNEMLRRRELEFLRELVRRQFAARGMPDPGAMHGVPLLSDSALTIGAARRFAPYKRADLLFADEGRLDALVNHPTRPVQLIYAGKAHPRDDEGKRIIQRIYQASLKPRFAGKIVFVEDYDLELARHLVQGVDVWLNTPRRPLEACGTSGMKAVLNGALNLSVLDGWWAEAYDGSNGFAIGVGSEHSDWKRQNQIDLAAAFDVLEREVVPTFYNRDADGVPREWLQRQKNALRTLAWRFSSHRMVAEYVKNCYIPAAGGTTSSFPMTEFPAREGYF